MMRRHRRLRKSGIKKQKIIITLFLIGITFLLASGYAAFSTSLGINAKGNLQNYTRTLATTYIINLYNNSDATLIDDGTNDHNIRYSGKPVNNYVCISNEKPCQSDNLYRIIGVFNNIKSNENQQTGETRIKLIKASIHNELIFYDTSGSNGNNNWARPAELNTAINAFPIASSPLIDNAVWNLGGSNNNEVTSAMAYEFERGQTTNLNNESPATWTGKIAMMYPSDYGFASSDCYQIGYLGGSESLTRYDNMLCTNSNWLYGNHDDGTQTGEWFLSPYADSDCDVWRIYNTGMVFNYNQSHVSSSTYYIRPTFYIKSNVNIIENGNDGSKSKPYYLELPKTN